MGTHQNPYLGYGQVVYGPRFVGREHGLETVRQHTLDVSDGSSIAIVGLAKVGKSSLLQQALMQEASRLLASRVLPLWINVAQHPTGEELMRALVARTSARLAKFTDTPAWLTEVAQLALSPTPLWSDMMASVQEFFTEVRLLSWRPVFVLDEFDDARHLYKGHTSVFQSIRELAINPAFKVVFAIVARRPIAEIEEQAGGGSTLSEVLHKYRMPLFDDGDMELLLQRLTGVGVEVTDEIRRRAAETCGSHPYLLNRFCYEVAEQARLGRPLDLDEVCSARDIASTFIEHYERIDDFLHDLEMYEKLLEIVLGPQVSATIEDATKLLDYGLIRISADGDYVPFSPHYESYLRRRARAVDLWPAWGDTERGVRRLLLREFTAKYGEAWPALLSKAHESAARILEGCLRRQAYEGQTYNGSGSGSLLEFTDPKDLWPLLNCEWPLFHPTFQRDRAHWAARFNEILPVRRALAHNRPVASHPERKRAEAACEEILDCLNRPAMAVAT